MTGKQNRKISARVSAVAQNAQLYCVLAFLRLFPAADEVENGLVVQMQHKSWLCISRMTKPCNTTQYRNIMPYNTIQYHTIPYIIPCNSISYQGIHFDTNCSCITKVVHPKNDLTHPWPACGKEFVRRSFVIIFGHAHLQEQRLGCVMAHASKNKDKDKDKDKST